MVPSPQTLLPTSGVADGEAGNISHPNYCQWSCRQWIFPLGRRQQSLNPLMMERLLMKPEIATAG